jgi:hypothetical protein
MPVSVRSHHLIRCSISTQFLEKQATMLGPPVMPAVASMSSDPARQMSTMSLMSYEGDRDSATGGVTEPRSEFINATAISTVYLNADHLIGVVPSLSECILTNVIYKANHHCEWAKRRVFLTSSSLLFSFEADSTIRDRIVLHEAWRAR